MAFNWTSFAIGAVFAAAATYTAVRFEQGRVQTDADTLAHPGVIRTETDTKVRTIPGVDTSHGAASACPPCGVESYNDPERGVLIQAQCEQVRVCSLSADGKDMTCSPWRGKTTP